MTSVSASVIIPHHNRSAFVREALESVRAQTVKPIEIILVDDHSAPEHLKAIQELAGMATILSVPQNLGLAGARNFGAQHATGEWLAFLDDDDIYLPDKLERQFRYVDAHPNVIAVGGALTMVTPDGRKEHWGGKVTGKVTLVDAFRHTASMAQSLLIRRDAFMALGGFDARLRYLEDYEFGIRAVASGREMHFMGEALFIYRRGGRRQLSAQWSRMLRHELRVLHMHRALARRVFGPLGPVRLMARACKKWGIRRGRMPGRIVWAAGWATEAVLKAEEGAYD
jgi:GT2 family glycosyltransferase